MTRKSLSGAASQVVFPSLYSDTLIIRLFVLTAIVLLGILIGSVSAKQALPPAAASGVDRAGGKISPGLQHLLDQADESQPLRVIVRLKKGTAADESDSIVKSRRARTIRKLKHEAQHNQKKILPLLDDRRFGLYEKLRKKGKAKHHKLQESIPQNRAFWLVNCVAATVSPQDLKEIVARPDVLDISENTVMSVPPVTINDSDTSDPVLNLWNLSAIGLDQISGLGIDGRGVRLGVIDTGLDPSHPDLAGKLVAWAEFGPHGEIIPSEPHDSHSKGHGTHVASVMAGDITGVAPGASLIAALALPGGSGTMEQVLAGMQWILDPDGDPESDDGAQVVNMSWGSYGTSTVLREATENMTAAGVLPVGAIGNLGPIYSLSPANAPGAVGVGATDKYDLVAWFSGGGEPCWYDVCLTKPDMAAPGVSIPGIGVLGNYQTLSGTSLAAPHVTGAAGLLLQIHPGLTLTQLKGFLYNTAVDLGYVGPDLRYGRGRLNLASAVDFAEVYAPRLGTADLVLETIDADENENPVRTYHSFYSDGIQSFVDHTAVSEPDTETTATLGLADVDGDGYADLIVRRSELVGNEDYLVQYRVYRSINAGGFSDVADTWHSFHAASAAPHEIIGLGDVNGDFKADLVYALRTQISADYYQASIHVLESNGVDKFVLQEQEWATFTCHVYYDLSFHLGDMNGDGKADLISGTRYIYATAPLSFYVNKSKGNRFEASPFPAVTISSAFFGPLRVVATADVNGDRWNDLVLSSQVFSFPTVAPVYVCLGTGSAMLERERIWANVPMQPGGGVAAAGDVNGDGTADLIVKTGDGNAPCDIWMTNAAGKFAQSKTDWLVWSDIPSNPIIRLVGAADIGLGNWR